jgi:hypothetical protein
MKHLTIIEAEQTVIKLLEQETIELTCFLFFETHCLKCNDFIELIVPWLESQNIEVYGINLAENFMPFPPGVTPTTYWYVLKDRPPMVKKGLPPAMDMLKLEVEKMLAVNKGEMTVEQAFF